MAVRLAALLPRAVIVALVWILGTAAFTLAADNTIVGPSHSNTSAAKAAAQTELVVPSVSGQAYVFAKGIENSRIYVNSAEDGQPFGGWEQVPDEITTSLQVGAASMKGRLFVAAVRQDRRVYFCSAPDGQPFSDWLEVPVGGATDTAVALGSLGQRVYMFARGTDNHVYANSAGLN